MQNFIRHSALQLPARLRPSRLARSVHLLLLGGLAASAAPVFAQAQAAGESNQQLERITVTGSNIRRIGSETPSPVQVISAEDMKKSGATSVQQVLQSITANGQGTLAQGFSGAFASGASGVSLRGLTVGATLVLIDGHRSAPYPIGDDGQRSFVDIANIPFDAVERIEVLKDGASAVYGSDAIAGVVNIILKRSFKGTTLNVDLGTSAKRDGSTYHVSGITGFGDLDRDGYNFYVSAEARKQNQIKYADRGGSFTQTDFTKTGGYDVTAGVINPLNAGLPRSGTGYITDADGKITGFFPGCDATKLAAGQCTYTDTWSQIQPATENYNLVTRYTMKLPADWQLSVQGTYFQSRSQQTGGPSRAFASGYQGITSGPGVVPAVLAAVDPTSIPSTNPSFPKGTGLTNGLLRYTFLDVGPTVTDTNARTTRLVADLNGSFAGWDMAAAAGYTEVKLDLRGSGSVNAVNLQQALNSSVAPYLVGGPNTAAVLGFIAPTLTASDSSKLSFLHVGASRDLIALGGGPLALALGADYVQRKQNALAPVDVAAGLVNSFSNNFTLGEQTVKSVYAELVAPITKQLEAEAAVRYDSYNLSGGKASPKVGFKWTPLREVALRGTAGRGFRAPGPAENGTAGQTYFTGTGFDPVLCAGNDAKAVGNFPSECAIGVGTVQGTTPTLKPETSKSFTLGLIVEPTKEFSASIDFYSIEINNQIVAGAAGDVVRGTNFTPIPQVQAGGGTALVRPSLAPIAFKTAGYANANSTKTSGVDIDLRWKHRFEAVGDFTSDFNVAYMNKYDVTIDGVTYKLAGTHGPLVIGGDTGSPKTRFKWVNELSRDAWSITGTVNYIGSYDLTDPSYGAPTCLDGLGYGAGASAYQDVIGNGVVPQGVGCKVKSFTTLDLSGRYDLNKQLSLHGSVLNLLNTKAPLDWGTYGGGAAPYNPSLHGSGAIGRYFSVGATYKF